MVKSVIKLMVKILVKIVVKVVKIVIKWSKQVVRRRLRTAARAAEGAPQGKGGQIELWSNKGGQIGRENESAGKAKAVDTKAMMVVKQPWSNDGRKLKAAKSWWSNSTLHVK